MPASKSMRLWFRNDRFFFEEEQYVWNSMCDKKYMESMAYIEYACNVLCLKGRKIENSRSFSEFRMYLTGLSLILTLKAIIKLCLSHPCKNAASDYNTASHSNGVRMWASVCVCVYYSICKKW